MSAENVHRETGLLADEPSHVSDAFVEAAGLEAAVLDSLAETPDDGPAGTSAVPDQTVLPDQTVPDQTVAEPDDADSADSDSDASDADADDQTPTPTTVRNSRLRPPPRPPAPCPPNASP